MTRRRTALQLLTAFILPLLALSAFSQSAFAATLPHAITGVSIVEDTLPYAAGLFAIDIDLTIPDSATAGDTTSICLNDTNPGLFSSAFTFDLMAPDPNNPGQELVLAHVNVTGNCVVFTFTDYVDNYSNITATAELNSVRFGNPAAVANSTPTVTFVNEGGDTFTDTIAVGDLPATHGNTKVGYWAGGPGVVTDAILWVVGLGAITGTEPGPWVVTDSSAGEGWVFDCSTLNTSANGNNSATAVVDSCDGSGFQVTFTNITSDGAGQLLSIYATLTDSRTSYANTAYLNGSPLAAGVGVPGGEGGGGGTLNTPTPTPPATETPTPTATATEVPPTETPIPTPTATEIPATETPTPSPTATEIPATETPTPSPTGTEIPETETPTPTPTATDIPATETPTPTETATEIPATETPTPTATVTVPTNTPEPTVFPPTAEASVTPTVVPCEPTIEATSTEIPATETPATPVADTFSGVNALLQADVGCPSPTTVANTPTPAVGGPTGPGPVTSLPSTGATPADRNLSALLLALFGAALLGAVSLAIRRSRSS